MENTTSNVKKLVKRERKLILHQNSYTKAANISGNNGAEPALSMSQSFKYLLKQIKTIIKESKKTESFAEKSENLPDEKDKDK